MSAGALLLGHGSTNHAGRQELSSLRELVGRRLGFEVGLGVLEFGGAGRGDLLLFVGRGSSEPLARRQTERVAEIVAREVGAEGVVCYAGISRPDLVEGMELALGRAPERVLALPYLLHTGVLVRRVSEVLAPLAARAGADLVVLPHIGNAPELVEVVAGRLERLL